MRRTLALGVMAVLLCALAGAGCARGVAGADPSPSASPVPTSSGSDVAEIYVQVLRRYLGTPGENSFPGTTFATVYVLDRADPSAADPMGGSGSGAAIDADTQRRIVAEVPPVTFVADRNSVLENQDRCASVRNGGILVTLGTVDREGDAVHVGVNGFVACLGATWLTYVLQQQPGSGWRVTGTTGSMAIA